MKILHVINSLNMGGAEKLVVETVPFYQRKQISVDVLCLNKTKTPLWTILEKDTKTGLKGLTSGSVYNPLLIFKLMSYLKKYDLVHGHLFPALYWLVLAKWLSFSKVKIVYTEHSTDNRRRTVSFFRFIDKVIYRGVAKIITISKEVDAKAKAHLGFKEDRFRLIYNGVNTEKFTAALPLDKSDFFHKSDFLIIQVSSFRRQKDQATLIAALQYLPEAVKLLLVGEGPLRADNEKLTASLNLADRVQFLGVRNDVPNLLKTADVAILSSHYEGLSLSSIEGMLSGPFIASNVPGLREIVGGYGLLFAEGNSKELADHIVSLFENNTYYEEIKNRCLKRAECFSVSNMTEGYIGVYKELL